MINNIIESDKTTRILDDKRINKINQKINQKINNKNKIPVFISLKRNNKFTNNLMFDNNKHISNDNHNINKNNKIVKLEPTIKTIHNVFKSSFNNNANPTGFGDYIRGCYFILQFCREYNLSYDFHIIQHPISKYLTYFNNKQVDIVSSKVDKCEYLNAISINDTNNEISYQIENNKINDFIEFLNTRTKYGGNVFINTHYYPRNIINKADILFIRQILQPTEEIINDVNKKLNNLFLKKHTFDVIHVRMGDDYLLNKNKLLDVNKLNNLFKYIKILPNNNYLLITDCYILKKYIINVYPYLNIKFILNDITHTVDNATENGVKNTLIDYYMMSYSNNIHSFSTYIHGSGFSKWCATTYGIPYSCKLLT